MDIARVAHPVQLRAVVILAVLMCVALAACGSPGEGGVGTFQPALPCLTAEESAQYYELSREQDRIAARLNAGESDSELWQEANTVAARLGYLINASNVRSTASGCRPDWY